MKQINHQNFDQWLFDYFEGELSPEEQKTLFKYIEEDPARKVDFETMGNSYVFHSEVAYPEMHHLLVPVSTHITSHIYVGLILLLLFAGGLITGNYIFRNDHMHAVAEIMPLHADSHQNGMQNTKSFQSIPDNTRQELATGVTSVGIPDGHTQTSLQTLHTDRQNSSSDKAEQPMIAYKNNKNTQEQNITAFSGKEMPQYLNEKVNHPEQLETVSGDADARSRALSGDEQTIIQPNEQSEHPAFERKISAAELQGTMISDPSLVKLTSSPIYIHPSFAGSAESNRISLAYRNQMPSYPGNLVTYFFSYDAYIHSLRSGIALISYYNNTLHGTVSTWYNGLIISPKIRFSKQLSVEPALQMGFIAMHLNESKLTAFDNTDPNYGYTYDPTLNNNGSLSNSHLLDLSAGLLAHWNKFYGGFNVDHITQTLKDPTDAAFLPRRYAATAGMTLKRYRNSDFSFSPNIMFDKQYKTTNLLWSSSFSYKFLLWGIGFGNQDRFVVMLGFQKDRIRFGYNFDTQISQLGSNAASAHEISLRYCFGKKNAEELNQGDDVVTLLK